MRSFTRRYRITGRCERDAAPDTSAPVAVRPSSTDEKRVCVSRTAQLLALAYHVESLRDTEVVADYSDAARRLTMTRARMTQVMDLLLLSPLIQEQILDGSLTVTERALRAITDCPEWQKQLVLLQESTGART